MALEGILPISSEVQRTIKGAAIWAVHVSLCKLCGLSVTLSDQRGVVQALNKDEVGCSSGGHWSGTRSASGWVEGVTTGWPGPKQHTTLEEKAKMTPEYRQVIWAKTGAIQDGAAVAVRVAKEAMDTRTLVHAGTRTAATFHEGVEELVDMEEVSEERNNKPWWLFGFEQAEGRKHRMIRAVGM